MSREAYYDSHVACPKCGNVETCCTTIGFLVDHPRVVDMNRAWCHCGWSGVVDDLVAKEKVMTFHPIERPTEPGWYWHREHMIVMGEIEPFRVIQVVDDGGHLFFRSSDGNMMPLKYIDGFWFGPAIPEPTSQPSPPMENQTWH